MTKQEQTKLRLLNMINEGNLPDGHLPGERELAVSFGVGRNTLSKSFKGFFYCFFQKVSVFSSFF